MTADAALRPPFAWQQTHISALFCAALFLSAATMFMLQPMTGKMLLPLVGGTPSGWIVAMAFFQLALLAGYALANICSRLSPRMHGIVFLAALGLGGLFLPIHLSQPEGAANAWMVMKLLAGSLGLPFVALAMASSTLQRLFTVSGHAAAGDPYFLYAASNLGSFAGLLLYPLAAEKLLTIPEQAQLWLSGYVVLIALTAICIGRAKSIAAAVYVKPAPLAAGLRWRWIMFAFIPSSLMMGVTTQITTAIIAAPLLWVLPLGIYLLTFVLAFGKSAPARLSAVEKLHPMAVCLAFGLIFLATVSLDAPWLIMVLLLGCFGIVALAFHMKLAALRPLGDGQRLTDYYLMIALGGALGGMLNAFLAPAIFDRLQEFPMVLAASLLFHPGLSAKLGRKDLVTVCVGGVGLLAWAFMHHHTIGATDFLEIFLVTLFVATLRKPLFALTGCLLLMTMPYTAPRDGEGGIYQRNFYGLIRVYERNFIMDGEKYHIRYFGHGTTLHGMQSLDPDMEDIPTAYFSHGGPVGDIFHTLAPKNVAVMGLGAGTLACHHAPDRSFTFFEIDPAVVNIARDNFTFLKACPGATPHRIFTGDGRLEIAKLRGEKFDLIILDAFSSDMVPVHLISVEAIELYKTLLTDNGILAFNISNNYVTLAATLAAGAKAAGMQARYKHYGFIDPPLFFPSDWLLMARDGIDMTTFRQQAWVPPLQNNERAWTDNYSNIIGIMRF
ncbi:MAG: hypothetical protein K0R10_1481 [Alphaproteobacteria bacterium]|jgi:spermidine synthase|nr:hypothetical protein [Alphaproteobacteria bacterium]